MHRARACASILEERLRRRLREGLGGTYGASVEFSNLAPLPGHASMAIQFGCEPSRVDSMVAATLAEVGRLRQEGPSADGFRSEQEIERRELEVSEKENGTWLSLLSNFHEFGWDPLRIARRRSHRCPDPRSHPGDGGEVLPTRSLHGPLAAAQNPLTGGCRGPGDPPDRPDASGSGRPCGIALPPAARAQWPAYPAREAGTRGPVHSLAGRAGPFGPVPRPFRPPLASGTRRATTGACHDLHNDNAICSRCCSAPSRC